MICQRTAITPLTCCIIPGVQNKQQQLTKHKQEEQKKHDKAPAKKPVAGTA